MADIVSAHGILSHPIRTHKYEKADARPPYAKRVYEYVAYGHQVEAMLVYAHSVVLGSRFQARPALTKLTETHMAERAYPAPQNEVFRRLALGHAMLPPPPLSQDVNGVLCRILPLALVYRHAPQSVVKDVVRGAVYPWHGTPELLDAGVLLFAFVKAAALCGGRPNPESLWGVLVEHAAPQSASVEALLMGLKGILAVQPNGPQEGWSMALEDACRSVGLDSGARSFVEDTALEAALLRKALGSLGVPQNSPLGVVAAVVVGVMRMWRQPLLAVVRTALMGGDGCDVTTSLVGGVLGALWGPEWLPREWVDKLENGNYGRDNMIVIAKRLAALDLTAYSPDW
jgi:ADP-ribosylglycohydrolase